MKLLWRALLDTLFPPLCHCCGGRVGAGEELHLCPACRDRLSFISSPLCSRCGIPFQTAGGIDHLCGKCSSFPPPFAAARAVVEFNGPARDLVHRFKYHKKEYLGLPLTLLAERLDPFVKEAAADVIVPVPLHERRLRERGYNQAVLLAAPLGKRWRLPLLRRTLRRVRWTEPQTTMTALERARNVRGAFALHGGDVIRGKRVLLVDDVYTTGSTVIECARTLREGGAAAVFVVTIARAAAP